MKNVYDLIISLISQTENICMWFDLTTFGLAQVRAYKDQVSEWLLLTRPRSICIFKRFLSHRVATAATAIQLIMREKRQPTSDSLIMRWRAETTSFHTLQSCLISIILFVNSHSISCSQPEHDWYGQSSHKGLGANFICHLINSFEKLSF